MAGYYGADTTGKATQPDEAQYFKRRVNPVFYPTIRSFRIFIDALRLHTRRYINVID